MQPEQIKSIVEAALMAADEPLSLDRLSKLFCEDKPIKNSDIKQSLEALNEELEGRAVELKQVSSGYRIQVKAEFAPWIHTLWQERPPRYSRALLETLAIITYKQPITRAEIEDIRGVAVSTNIVKTLSERGWVKVVGHKELPGRPALLATAKQFLDDFNLTSLEDLPSLAEIKNLDEAEQQLGQQLDLLTNLEATSKELAAPEAGQAEEVDRDSKGLDSPESGQREESEQVSEELDSPTEVEQPEQTDWLCEAPDSSEVEQPIADEDNLETDQAINLEQDVETEEADNPEKVADAAEL